MQQRFYRDGRSGLYNKDEKEVQLPYTCHCRICDSRLYTVETNGDVTVHTNYIDDDTCEYCGSRLGRKLPRSRKY